MENFNIFVLFMCTVYLIFSTAKAQRDVYLNEIQLSRIVENLEENLMVFHSQHSNMNLLPGDDSDVDSEEVNPESLILALEGKISALIEKRKNALKKIVDNLEDSTINCKWKNNLGIDYNGLMFLNQSTEEVCRNNDIMGVLSETFGVPILKQSTGIHVPVEVFKGYPEVENGLNCSSTVDTIFKENFEEDPSISWQYFATKAGFMRLYPAVTRWHIPPSATVDLFDAERRAWYIEASTSPKDVIILMDRSGSVHGQTFTIMKFAIQTLLDTLGENDYVNIAAFNESTHWVSDIIDEENDSNETMYCRNYPESLLQANHVNKKALIDDMQALTDVGMSNYTSAIEFAYEVFKKRESTRENGANCNKLIMLFSDGGTDWPEPVFKRFINDSDTEGVIIFTYAIGAHPIPTAVLKQMSCDTGGKFTTILTSSGVRKKIQESYVETISKPLAEYKARHTQFTSAFTSAVTDNLTLAIAMPVFNMSKELNNGSEWIGVAGIDIPVHHLENFSPRETLGPLGYPFIINQNGFLLMHPRLHSQYSYLENPPHVDILDMELSPDKLEGIRESLINHNIDRRSTITSKVLLDMNHVMDGTQIAYTIKPITGTTYSLGIVSRPYSKHLRFRNLDIPTSPLDERVVLAGWNFCGSQPSPADAAYLNNYTSQNFIKCNRDLKNGLFWANKWMYRLQKDWKANTGLHKDIINKAIYTRFGLSFITESKSKLEMAFDDVDNFVNASFAPDDDQELNSLGREWRNPNNNPALKRGILQEGLSIFPHRNGAFISKPASVKSVVVAAVGVNVTDAFLDSELKKAVTDVYRFDSSYVLFIDESASIISSSLHEESAGEFLGERWPKLLEKLVSVGIYSSVNISDFQAMCERQQDSRGEASSAIRLDFFLHPFKFIGSAMLQIFSFFEYLQLVIMHLLFTSSPSYVDAASKTISRQSCIIDHTIYYRTLRQTYQGAIECENGASYKVLVQGFNSINALLVSVEKDLVDKQCDGFTPPRVDPENEVFVPMKRRIVRPKELACQRPRYRKRPNECYEAEAQKCNKAPLLLPGNLLVVSLLLVIAHHP